VRICSATKNKAVSRASSSYYLEKDAATRPKNYGNLSFFRFAPSRSPFIIKMERYSCNLNNASPFAASALCSHSCGAVVALAAFTLGTSRMKSAACGGSSVLRIETVRRGRWSAVSGLACSFRKRRAGWPRNRCTVDQVFARAGARVKLDSILMQMSNRIWSGRCVMRNCYKESEAELANLRVPLQAHS